MTSCIGFLISMFGTRMCGQTLLFIVIANGAIAWWHCQWPWRTPNPVFKVTVFLKSNILGTKYNTNRKSYTIFRMVPLSLTLSDLWPGFQGHDIFWSRISWKQLILKTKLLLHKRKLYLTYGMVLCLVTLTDLQMRCTGLSASAKLLVTNVC